VSFPANLTRLGFYCFKGCRSLQSIALPTQLDEVPLQCFANCDALERIVIPPLVTSIGVDAFVDCQNLWEVVIPASTTIIPSAAFENCPSLRSFDVHPDNPSHTDINGVWFNKDVTQLKCYPDGRSGPYVVPPTVTTMENLAFSDAALLTGVRLPTGLTKIPILAFASCLELRWIEIPAAITDIGTSAFTNCVKLERVVFQGVAPVLGSSVFTNVPAPFAVYFFDGAAGFTAPVWQGYPAVGMGARTPAKEWLISHELPHDTNLDQEMAGLHLLLAYALDLNPHNGAVAQMPTVVRVDGRLEMEFLALRADVTYQVQFSNDLSNWEDDMVTTVSVPGGPMRRASVDGGARAGFLRLVVQR
jgi:hypothetical protein